jgi:hypothetical protein
MKTKTERYKTVRKRTYKGRVVSRLVENRATGERKYTINVDQLCNRK